jgi:hypothetical protein
MPAFLFYGDEKSCASECRFTTRRSYTPLPHTKKVATGDACASVKLTTRQNAGHLYCRLLAFFISLTNRCVESVRLTNGLCAASAARDDQGTAEDWNND